jgi:Family of unknown function (DUF6079)
MSEPLSIGDLVEVPPIRTVIRLAEGTEHPEQIASSFVFTPEVFAHFGVLAEALSSGKGQGYFLQGDFGAGKSHFLAALRAWISGSPGAEDLAQRHAGLGRLSATGAHFLPAAISLVDHRSSKDLESIVLEAVARELGMDPGQWRSENRLDTFTRMLAAARAAGHGGVVLLIDELSEFLRAKPSPQALNEDARTLQLLGEMAAGGPLWIVAAVQESIERTGDLSQAIVRKIKDRFPVKMALSTLHIKALLSQRLVRLRPGAEEELYRIHERLRGQFPGFRFSFEEFRAVYPVHPKTISLLEGLGGLFSQHRGIVDFVHSRIAGDPARGIPSHLGRPASELLAPDSIYDHFSQRLAEFSAFHIYPRHVVPHLDEVIERTLGNPEDRLVCRRVVRMLVLYRIHPTAGPPSVAELAELASCSLDAHSPELNARFLAEAILDPVAASSKFLARVADPGGDPRKAAYRIVTEDDPAKLLAARISRKAAEPAPDDSRLLRAPLARLPESDAWPGKALLTEGMRRSVTWLGSERKAFLCFLSPGEEDATQERVERECASDVDFAVIFSVGKTAFAAEHAAVWTVPVPQRQEALREFLASLLVAAELRPGNPAEAPLISEAQEQVKRREAGACQAAVDAFYQGEFTDAVLRVEASVRQLRRFDRLLECAAEGLLEKRYPRFRDVAPRRFPASARMYQQLLEEFVGPGSLSLTEARARSLGPAIDGLAFPLGLVEIKRNSYHFAPDITEHALLTFFFTLLRPASATPLAQVLERLQRDVFGLPRDTALFLVASLAVGGLISVRRSGRSLPLEQLGLQTIEKADELLPGELIGSADRSTLLTECAFLAPASAGEAFGLRQQREAWKEVIKLRDLASGLIPEIRQKVAGVVEFSAFSAFDFKAFETRLTGLETVAREIKASLGAKEGLERFLAAWRGTGLTADDVELLKGLGRFLSRGAEQFVFVAHYLRHPAVEQAAAREPQVAALRQEIHALIDSPVSGVLADGGERLSTLFVHFRERYTVVYAGMHDEFHRAREPQKLSRQASRALGALRLLASIDCLDRPPDLGRLLDALEPRAPQRCARHVSEELLRAAVCGCGFQPGDSPAIARTEHPEEQIESALASFIDGLVSPRVREAVAARAFALQDANPGVARRLGELSSALTRQTLSPAALIDLLDASLCHEIEQALAGRVPIVHAGLDDLARKVAGRRLPAERIEALVRDWLADAARDAGTSTGASALIAVEEGNAGGGEARVPGSPVDPLAWWRLLHPGLLRADPVRGEPLAETTSMAAELEARHPSARLAEELRLAGTDALLRFVSREPFHTQAIRAAWLIVAERLLGGERSSTPAQPEPLLADPSEAARLMARLRALLRYGTLRELAFPERLEARLCIDSILSDPWSTDELRRAGELALADMEATGGQWLASLPPAGAMPLQDNPVALIMDGVSADLWLANADSLNRAAPGARWEWLRLEGKVATPDSLALQLGLEGDPLEVLASNGIPYVQYSGREENLAAALAGSLSAASSPGRPAVARIALVDRAAHRGELRLGAMAEAFAGLLQQQLPGVVARCQSESRPLVLTADHGLSLVGGRLTHGEGGKPAGYGGGVFERTICRIVWIPRGPQKRS